MLNRLRKIRWKAAWLGLLLLEYSGKTRMREWLARVKAWLDVYVLRTAPKFYGPPVEIKIPSPTPGK